MRSKKNQSLIWVLLGLLILGLIGFGGSQLGQTGASALGTVGDEEIEVNTYANQLRALDGQLSQAFGRQLTAAEAETFGISAQALQQTIGLTALDSETARLGISVGDETVQAEIISNRQFHGLSGGFDREAYNFALERANLSVKDYENNVRQDNSRALFQTIVVGAPGTDTTAAATLFGFAREARDFEWVKIDAEVLGDIALDATDEGLLAYYEANPAAYTAPETKKIDYAWINPDILADKVEIPEEDLKQEFASQDARFNKPARRAVDRLVFGNIEDANAARAKLDSSIQTFDEIVEERGLTIADIDLGELSITDMSTAEADVVFGADDLGIVGPVETDLGPALFRINAIFAEVSTTYAEAYEELKSELAVDEARRMILDEFENIDDLIAAGAEITELSQDTLLEAGSIDFSVESEEGIAAYDEFRQAATAAQVGDFLEIIDLADGGVFVLMAKEIVPPTLQAFDTVKTRLTADWRGAETLNLLQDKADAFSKELALGTSFETLGLAAQTQFGATRDAFVEGVPVDLILELFTAQTVGADRLVKATQDNEVFLARLNAITPINVEDPELGAQIENTAAQINIQISQDILSAFTDVLSKEAVVNQNLVAQVNAQYFGGR
jgi:peptidyl-prolyl cis-trans isomerase D